ncbi:melanin-concentrating hormone receptor 1-like [Clytia hemisphaerica]|uniref:melanin-concentrating hormone receptor 1-like n=1 Tax=Clytia hemisphaerica TaxID=252671 RepID=UPI0034D40FFE
MITYSLTYIDPVIFGLGSICNILVIIYFVKINFKKLNKMSVYHFLIINLAVADLFVSVGTSINYPLISQPSWKYGEFACVFLRIFLGNALPIISSWLLVLISFARYRTISYPLHAYKLNKKKYGVVCLLVWIVPPVLNTFSFINTKVIEYRGFQLCLTFGLVQMLCNFIMDSFLPAGIMLILYYKMKKKMKFDENHSSFPPNPQSRTRNRSALRTVNGLIAIFIITVIPTRIHILFTWVLDIYLQLSKPLFYDLFMVYSAITYPLFGIFYMNSILNVFIYAKMIPGFRGFLLMFVTLGVYGNGK